MENLEKIKTLLSNSAEIDALFTNHIPKWESDKKHYDKNGWGFNLDSRFASCKSINISFDTWSGVYGDSSCSRVVSLDAEIFDNHFLAYLNANKEQILKDISERITKEAVTLKDKAEAELNNQLELLKHLK